MPKVSVITPVYNGEKYLQQAIHSVLTQSFEDWEFVVVDDGSTDSTPVILSEYSDPRLIVLSQVNSGEAAARNKGLDHAQGELIAFLDADDIYLPHHLSETVTYLNQYRDRDAVYTDGYHIDQEGQRLNNLSSRRRGPFEGWVFPEVVRAADVFGPPMVVVLRRELVDQHAIEFDPRIVIGPDWDFLTRYSEIANFGYIDKPTCLYRIHTTNISVLTGMQNRRLSLAICREKAIKLPSFKKCSLEIQSYVFYDLLINNLTGLADRQEAVSKWMQFQALPRSHQARLLRLMAGMAIASGGVDQKYILSWLERSCTLRQTDLRTIFIELLFNYNPTFCKRLLRYRYRSLFTALDVNPFADII
jgi:glycosyltransferase involved in cell wall biosynthesis